jgi:hypothetical protein
MMHRLNSAAANLKSACGFETAAQHDATAAGLSMEHFSQECG